MLPSDAIDDPTATLSLKCSADGPSADSPDSADTPVTFAHMLDAAAGPVAADYDDDVNRGLDALDSSGPESGADGPESENDDEEAHAPSSAMDDPLSTTVFPRENPSNSANGPGSVGMDDQSAASPGCVVSEETVMIVSTCAIVAAAVVAL